MQNPVYLGSKVDVVPRSHGRGPLHLAAEMGHADICTLLVRMGFQTDDQRRAALERRSSKGF